MPLIAELVTKLEADSTNFNKQLNNSENKLANFGKTAGKVGAGIALAMGTVAVGGFFYLLHSINETAEKIDDLAKRAHKFGGEVAAFQRLEYVASLAGVGTDKLEAGLSRLVKAMADAKRGTGEAKNAFKELGLSVADLDKMSVDKQYIAISDALKLVTDENRQAQLAVQIFGRSGVEQLNLLRENLSGLSADFDKFGGGLSNEQAKAVEDYNDSMTRLGAVFDTFKIQLTAQVAPALEKISTFIADQIVEFGGLGNVANITAQYMVKGLLLVVQVIQSVINGVNTIVDSFKKAQLTLAQFAQQFSELNFQVFGGEFNFERAEKIARLQRDLANSQSRKEITAPLQQGLREVQSTLQPKQQMDITVTTEKGLAVEIAESQAFETKIRNYINSTMSSTASRVGK